MNAGMRTATCGSFPGSARSRTSACMCCGPHVGESRNSTALPAAAPL